MQKELGLLVRWKTKLNITWGKNTVISYTLPPPKYPKRPKEPSKDFVDEKKVLVSWQVLKEWNTWMTDTASSLRTSIKRMENYHVSWADFDIQIPQIRGLD